MIRRATVDDVPSLARLDQALFAEDCFSERTIENELEHGVCWIATSYGELGYIDGYIFARYGAGLADVLRLGVHAARRRQGLARRLMQAAITHTTTDVILTVRKDNTPAQALYEKLGFRPVAHLPQHGALVLRRARVTSF